MQPARSPDQNTSSISGRSARLSAARYGIGAVMVLAAVAVLVIVPDSGFGSTMAYGFGSAIAAGLSVLLIKAGVSVVLPNLLYHWSISRDRDRKRAGKACRTLDGDGVWPDDEDPQKPDPTHRRVVPQGEVAAGSGRPARGDRIPVTVQGER